MVISTDEALVLLKDNGRICAVAMQTMADALEPGITTAELDAIGRKVLEDNDAQSAPEFCYQFPGATCISVNEEIAHGIPGARVIQPGDLVNIDVSAELDGFFADTGASFVVGTHTHVPTADHRILPGGTAFQTDAGMCGDYDSSLGMEKEEPINRFISKMPKGRFEAASGPATICGVGVLGWTSRWMRFIQATCCVLTIPRRRWRFRVVCRY